MFALLVLWSGISVPLGFLGAYLRCPRETDEVPSANQPYSTAHSRTTVRDVPKVLYFVSGIVPFGAVYSEFFFDMSALWQQTSVLLSLQFHF